MIRKCLTNLYNCVERERERERERESLFNKEGGTMVQ